VRNPFATYAFMDLLSDRAGYPELLLRLLATMPVYLLTEGVAALAGFFGGKSRQARIRDAIYL